MGDVIQLPVSALRELADDPDALEIVDCDVPERPQSRAARRPWFEERWRAFHLLIPGEEFDRVRIRLHFQFRRRRR